MIQEFVKRFQSPEGQAALRAAFATHPGSYEEIVKAVVTVLAGDKDYDAPDPERIHAIDDGDYQGTLIFVIAAKGYQPWDYWYVKVGYGSCSGCDTLQAVRGWEDDVSESQINDYMTLALHIVQGLKKMGEDDE